MGIKLYQPDVDAVRIKCCVIGKILSTISVFNAQTILAMLKVLRIYLSKNSFKSDHAKPEVVRNAPWTGAQGEF